MADQMLPPVTLPRSLYDDMIAHAREGEPEEVCGVLRGRGLTATVLYRGRNIATDRINNYEVDPQTLLLQFEFEDEGDEMMGIYHSHPISEAYPSATDAWNAHYPDSIYFICSLEDDDAPAVRAFRMTPQSLDVGGEAALAHLLSQEVRPGLYGYFQDADLLLPTAVADVAASAAPPFYVVFAVDEASGELTDARLVVVREHEFKIADAANL